MTIGHSGDLRGVGLALLLASACAKDAPVPSGADTGSPTTRTPPATPVPAVVPSQMPAVAKSARPTTRPLLATARKFDVHTWSPPNAPSLEALRGCVVVVRFWTNTCPYCRRSMPVIQRFSETLAGKPVRFVGLYHPKPRGREGTWEEALETATTWGITFPIAYDRDWKTLDAWWLKLGERRATSVTFVLDARGDIAHIDPGPELSDDAAAGKPFAAFVAVRAAIAGALPRAPGC